FGGLPLEYSIPNCDIFVNVGIYKLLDFGVSPFKRGIIQASLALSVVAWSGGLELFCDLLWYRLASHTCIYAHGPYLEDSVLMYQVHMYPIHVLVVVYEYRDQGHDLKCHTHPLNYRYWIALGGLGLHRASFGAYVCLIFFVLADLINRDNSVCVLMFSLHHMPESEDILDKGMESILERMATFV
ncbi:hypothetical protein ACJX0J_020342, partial [Zea mays]